MQHRWFPTALGLRLSRSPAWSLHLDQAQHLTARTPQAQCTLPLAAAERVQLRRWWFWSELQLRSDDAGVLTLRGLSRADGRQVQQLIDQARAHARRLQRQQQREQLLQAITGWVNAADALCDHAVQQRQWITHEQQQALLQQRAAIDLGQAAPLFAAAAVQADEDAATAAAFAAAINDWQADWPTQWEQANQRMCQRELEHSRRLLERVESRPLSEEQARAVVCFDNRVQLVAAAGSGKTSTMVAKAAYAIARGLAQPGQIVMLAFNKEAAGELQARAQQAFARLGQPGWQVQAATFHALGLQIIGQASGRKPHVPEWAIDAQAGVHKLAELVDTLKDRSPAFRTQWDLFRLVFGHPLPATGTAISQADGHGRDGRPYARTLRGEPVNSQEECLIANWLFYNGVDYRYGAPYCVDTATASHRQYHPDFYYPAADLWHEHFALDADGQPPLHFSGYQQSMDWKRLTHRLHGTRLIETSSHQLRSGQAFDALARALDDAGIQLDPNPDREIPSDGQVPLADSELIALIRCFIGHAKSNGLDSGQLQQRLTELPAGDFRERQRRFLQLVAPVMQAWDNALAAEHGIDFEDMLNQAATLLESGQAQMPWTLVMADEFQDASRARARLCRALVAAPHRHLFAVGDDWQSINRFAGADLGVMTGFVDYFGHGRVLQLTQTFRCPQALCDIAGAFVSKNPAQLRKQVVSSTPAHGPVLQALQVARREQLPAAIRQLLAGLVAELGDGRQPPGRSGKLQVFVLGRYTAERACIPDDWQAAFGQWLELRFSTIHRAKGAEADVVILPGLIAGRFPSTRGDDPALALAMPAGDSFPLGEERRLLYVALTRARRRVVMLGVQGRNSPFLDELVASAAVQMTTLDGKPVKEQRCPACGSGVIMLRSGPYGQFHACSGYPRCAYKPPQGHAGQPSPRATALP